MAFIKCDFFSEVLTMSTSMTVILPQKTKNQIGMEGSREGDERIPTLYLLHGFSDDDSIWTRRTSIERYVSELGIAVVMPQVHHSFYTDMVYGNNYWTFLTEELPTIARSFFPLSDKREDNFVAGLSMGGYGAFKWALNYPERFAVAASLSGTLDIVRRAKLLTKDDPLSHAIHLIFGDQDITNTNSDLLYLLQTENLNKQSPKLFLCCGTEDFLYEDNVTFKDCSLDLGYDLTYDFSEGNHEWGYWDAKIQDVLRFLPLKRK